MNIKTIIRKTLLAATIGYAATINAAVTPEEAQKLKGELTPMGAERKGNASGNIPAYTGTILGAPSWVDYKGTGTHYPEMYPNEKPLFYIDASNFEKYKEHLTPGQIAIIKKNPNTFKMPIYQSHRDVRYPDFVHDNTFKNATRASLVNGVGVEGAFGGTPFPIPNNGAETIWNHLMYPRQPSYKGTYAQAAVFPTGDIAFSRYYDVLRAPVGDETITQEEFAKRDVMGYFIRYMLEPVRQKGEIILVHEYMNQAIHPRGAWAYMPGTRRVRQAPTVGYDNPSGAGGLRTDDERGGFNGAIDRYTWTLHGKKEIFIPYHNYKLENKELTYKDILKPNHPDPELYRYELHRVWVVEANLKSDARHVYAKRFFYLDEDSWMAHLADNYDGKGNLWRSQIIASNNAYDMPGISGRVELLFDLQNGAYVIDKLYNEEKKALEVLEKPYPFKYFTPSNLRKLGSR